MTLIGRNGKPLTDPARIPEIALTPEETMITNNAIRDSVQEFPPPMNTGAFFAHAMRGPILEAFGTKARDKQLRTIYRNEYNNLVQGTIASLSKKVITTPWEIKGDDKHLFYIPNAQGQMKSIKAVEHYQILLQSAQFGMGWEFFLSQFLEDFFTQDFGAILELAGLGEPTGPIDGPIMSVAHLDAGRCYVTGNPYYPIMYASLISGSLHRMHTSRIVRFVDQPSPAEEFFGIGLCALSRVIAVVSRQMLMNRYIEQQVDDKPKPGITAVQGMTDKQLEKVQNEYVRQQQNDERPFWGKTMFMTSVNIDNPIKVENFPFAETPPNFDWEKYNSLDVNAIALAFNTDRQEIWELQGRGLGSGAQSQILHQKSEGKMFGYILQNIERMMNRRVLLPDWTFEFKYKDPSQEQLQSTIDLTRSQAVTGLQAAGTISADESRQYLANSSQEFKDVLTDEKGEVIAADAAVGGPSADVAVEDSNNVSLAPQAPAPTAQPAAPVAKPTVPQIPVKKPVPQLPVAKAFSITSANFERQFVGAFSRALGGRMPRSQFEGLMLGFLSSEGAKAFADGLRSGGDNEPPDAADQATIQDWLVDQIDYIDGLANELYNEGANPDLVHARAEMWVNKSLSEMFEKGRLSANPNRTYQWQLGQTEEHCADCLRLSGQVHTMQAWTDSGFLPHADQLECHGFRCDCSLIPTNAPESGEF